MKTRSMVAAASILIPLCACSGFRPRPQPGEETRLKVPYFADRREQWGPAAVADVLSFWGKEVEPKALMREIHFTRDAEDVVRELQKAGRVRGFKAELIEADLRAIKKELDAGRPVIALVNIGFGWLPVRSYAVVTGYSNHRRCVYAHWGPNRDFYVSYRQFESDWGKAGSRLLKVTATKAEPPKTEPPAPPPVAVIPPPADVSPAPPPAARRRRMEDVDAPAALDAPRPPEMIWLSP